MFAAKQAESASYVDLAILAQRPLSRANYLSPFLLKLSPSGTINMSEAVNTLRKSMRGFAYVR